MGLALEKFEESGRFDQVLDLYQNNAFFRTLVYNSMMSLTKSFFKLTAYMQNDPNTVRFGIRSMQNITLQKILVKAHWTVRIDGKRASWKSINYDARKNRAATIDNTAICIGQTTSKGE